MGGESIYNRQAAWAYSEQWWNKRNPMFPDFSNDCTNFVSQCLLAGGISMRYGENEWWINSLKNRWSLSWSVAHSLRWFLLTSKIGVQVNMEQLKVGDIIFYDFQGNGRIDHCTIVQRVEKSDLFVNAHTSDSYERHYSYLDSSAYTGNIRYYFVTIAE